MGVRPPTDDDGFDDGDVVTFGIAAVDARLKQADLTFPATAAEVVEALDDPDIEYGPQGRSVALSTALENVPQDRFERRQELMNALHPVFEEYRAGSGGVVSWLRSVLPGGN